MDYDASLDAGGVTIGLRRTDGGRIAAFWDEPGDAPIPLGEYGPAELAAPTSRDVILPDGRRTPEGGRAWIHGDRVAVIDRPDWRSLLARLGLSPN